MADVFVARTEGGGNGLTGISSWGGGVTGESGVVGVQGVSDGWIGVAGHGPEAGVYGEPTVNAGTGVRGQSVAGKGLDGYSEEGIGVRAHSDKGIALHVDGGRLRVESVSGVAVIAAARSSVTVQTLDVVQDSFVLLTPRTNLRGRGLWYTTDTEADTFTIHISEPRSKPTAVAWLLLG
jgi:hypothetical protein